MITAEQIAQIEATIEKKAEEIAYSQTEHYSDKNIQRSMYDLTKSNIILGARLFQEHLKQYDSKETTIKQPETNE